MGNFTRSLNTFAGGAAVGIRSGAELGIKKNEMDAWKELGEHYQKYLDSKTAGATAPTAGMQPPPKPPGASGMQEMATPGPATPGIGAYMPTGGPQAAQLTPAPAQPAAPVAVARPSVRTLPFMGDDLAGIYTRGDA
jgi:hypothetical protein